MEWRGAGYAGVPPPEPWPGRVEAFMTACALHAGTRERDVLSALKGLGASSDSPAEG